MNKNHFEILERFFENELSTFSPKNIRLNIKNSDHIIIYGAGSGGIYTKYLLSLADITPEAFFDNNADIIKEVDGIKVYLPNESILKENEKQKTIVIIGVGSQKAKIEIENMMLGNGYPYVISYIELFNEVFLRADNKRSNLVGNDFYNENKKDILEALSYFEDEESKDIYCGFIRGHALKKNDYFAHPENFPKYIPNGINFNKGYDCFIDCGATMGETYEILEKNNIKPKKMVMFEPDKKNFSFLSKMMNKKDIETLLYPCAVYSKTEMVGFIQSGTQGSSIKVSNKNKVQGIALDDILINMNPTFIKMDIEGGEYEAILGSKKIIEESKPDLAICVYHEINHIWDIPILLKKLNSSYKFYLKSGNYFGMNTVLYVTNA